MNEIRVKDLKILVVDDEEIVRALLKKMFRSMDADVDVVTNGLEALEAVGRSAYDIVISDVKMPGMDGLTMLGVIREKHPDVDVIIMTSYSTDYTYMDVVSGGAIDFIAKPFSVEEIKAKVMRVARERHIMRELRNANERLEDAYAEILSLKDEEEKRCREINYERERLLTEQARLKEKLEQLGG